MHLIRSMNKRTGLYIVEIFKAFFINVIERVWEFFAMLMGEAVYSYI
jgi:hypothetical protein